MTREIEIDDVTTVAELAAALGVGNVRVIEAALHDLGRLATIHDDLKFDAARLIAARFGFSARPKAR
jgi:hypothetical protein